MELLNLFHNQGKGAPIGLPEWKRDTWVTPTDIPLAEAIALRWLYDNTAGDSWTTNTNWGQTTTANDWFGVTVAGGQVTQLALSNNNLVGTVALSAAITPFSAMTFLRLFTNASLIITGAFTDLPATLLLFYIYGTGSTVTDTLTNLPASIALIRLDTTSCVITGALSDLPAGVTELNANASGSTITGGGVGLTAVAIRSINIANLGLSQAQVDGIALRLYTDWATLTYATPSLNISGTNAAPSGIYQDGDPPTTGKEYIFEIVNDPEVTGNNTWTVTYTA